MLNADNRGFGPGCNQGAQLARGALLLFLNTDAIVRPGWLEPMVEALESAWVGAVVPRHLHEDGRLQEAGALLAQDGTVLTYGDGDRADRVRAAGIAPPLVREPAPLAPRPAAGHRL